MPPSKRSGFKECPRCRCSIKLPKAPTVMKKQLIMEKAASFVKGQNHAVDEIYRIINSIVGKKWNVDYIPVKPFKRKLIELSTKGKVGTKLNSTKPS